MTNEALMQTPEQFVEAIAETAGRAITEKDFAQLEQMAQAAADMDASALMRRLVAKAQSNNAKVRAAAMMAVEHLQPTDPVTQRMRVFFALHTLDHDTDPIVLSHALKTARQYESVDPTLGPDVATTIERNRGKLKT